ncbi:MAG: galactitol-1-phosphate 5-dehydrogenase [Planctomycetota bacterium]
MKALVLTQYNHLELQDWPKPEIAADEVLIRIAACGICGSDIHGMDGSTGRRQPPLIMGHEAAGTISEVGADVQGWVVGDRVTFDSTVYCGECWFCRRGDVNLCDKRRVLGVSTGEYRRHGAFAEFVNVPQRILVKLPEAVTFSQAAMVEPVSIALHAVRRTPLELNDTVVVVGAGMIGLFVIQALRAAGCGKIFAVDLDQSRLDVAVKLGADEGFLSNKVDVPAEIQRRTNGRGADAAFEVVGITPTLQTAIAVLRKGGQLTLVGNLSPKTELPLQLVVTRELTLHGSCASNGEYPACLDMIARGVIKVEPMITAEAPLSDGDAWFHRLKIGGDNLLKVLLKP